MSILGTRVARTEDPLFLTRGARYTEDLTGEDVDGALEGALHLTFVRSPVAHAKVTGIDTSEALQAPGVVAVYSAEDVADLDPVPPQFPNYHAAMTRPWLAGDTVRFVGEVVAAVLTEQRYQGEDAAELVDVDYEPLPAVVDTRDAVRDEVLVHAAAGTNVVTAFEPKDGFDPALFDDCEVVVSMELVNQRLAVLPLEGRAAAAAWHSDGRATLWCSTQNVQGAKSDLVRWLGLDRDSLRVVAPDVGGGFGAKIGSDPEFALVLLFASKLGRPVRWVESRSENMIGMNQGRGQHQTVTIGGRPDGTVLAYRLDIQQDCGAYPRFGGYLAALTRRMAPGVYAIDRVESRARAIATNTTPIGAYRGAGRPEAIAAIERAMDRFAAEIGMDPIEVRRHNLVAPDAFPYTTSTGLVYDSGDYGAALDRVLEAADYQQLREEQARRRERREARLLGLGVSCYVEITGGNAFSETAAIEVHPDGTATVLTGTSPHGQGHATSWAMLASEHLGIPIDQINVRHGDTDLVPVGAGTFGSRSLQIGGAAVDQAGKELVQLAVARAADVLEADPADLRYEPARRAVTVAGTPGIGVSLVDLAAAEPLAVHTTFDSGAPTFPFGAHLAVVEVDTETGQVQLQRLIAADDAGTVLNPLLAEGQRHGGIAQGVAQALYEQVRFDEDGNPLTGTMADYEIISAAEVPSFELVPIATPTPLNPLGAKGIGESGTIGSTPAVQNAVVDALAHLGVRHLDMPASPQRVWAAIRAAGTGEERDR